MTELKKLTEIQFDKLDVAEQVKYLKRSLSAVSPAFNRSEPAKKRSRLIGNLANRPIRTWLTIALILFAAVFFSDGGGLLGESGAIYLYALILIGLIAYVVFRTKVNAFFTKRNEALESKYASAHAAKLEKYNAELAAHNAELEEYNARELTYEQASSTVNRAIRHNGINYCESVLGIDESEMIALHFIVSPASDGVRKAYADQIVHSSYEVQYICMTDNELYEVSGQLDLLTDSFTVHDSSRVLYSKIKDYEERQNPYYALNFFTITTSNNDGSESDVMHLPSARLRPRMQYYIQSVTWASISRNHPLYQRLKAGRAVADRYVRVPLSFDEYEEALRMFNNLECRNYEVNQVSTETEQDVTNFAYIKLIVERAINRKVRESSMQAS